MNCQNIIILTILFFCKSVFCQYPNTIYSSSIDDEEDDEDNDDIYGNDYNDYMSDDSHMFLGDKRRSIRPSRIDPEALQEYLYNFKSNVLNDSNISTIKNKNFTWLLNKVNDNQKNQDDNHNIIDKNHLKPLSKSFKLNLNDLKKTTDWIDSNNGIQSDQPNIVSSSSSLNVANQTSVPENNADVNDDDDKENDDKIKANDNNQPNPPYAKDTDINKNNNYNQNINRTQGNNYVSNQSSNPVQPNYYPAIINRPYYPRLQQQNNRQNYYRQQKQPIINTSYSQPKYYSYQQQSQQNATNSNNKQDWSCLISSYNNCSMMNDPQIGPMFQHLSHNFFPYQSTKKPEWYLILNTTKFPANKIGARLITPYIPHNFASIGCLTLNYITTGNELDKIMIHQQDIDDNCIYSSSFSSAISDDDPSMIVSRIGRQQSERLIEHNVELTLNLRQSDPRFFIEIYVKRLSTRRSSFALSKMNLSYNRSCNNDQSNNCFPSAYPNGGATNVNVNRPTKRDQIPVEP